MAQPDLLKERPKISIKNQFNRNIYFYSAKFNYYFSVSFQYTFLFLNKCGVLATTSDHFKKFIIVEIDSDNMIVNFIVISVQKIKLILITLDQKQKP